MLNRSGYLVGILVAVSCVVTNVSCTKFVQVPADDFGHVHSNDLGHWRVQTEDGKVYAVARFSVTDSTFVIEELDSSVGAARGSSLYKGVPHVFQLVEIVSVEKVENTDRLNTVVMVSYMVVFALGVVLALSWPNAD